MGGKANQSEVHSGEGRISMQLKISKYIDDHASDMIAALSSLVAVPSVRGAAESGMPYGKEPARALSVMLNLAEKCGFFCKKSRKLRRNHRFDPTKETTLGVLCHLDVVPAGNGVDQSAIYADVYRGESCMGAAPLTTRGRLLPCCLRCGP